MLGDIIIYSIYKFIYINNMILIYIFIDEAYYGSFNTRDIY